MNNENNENNENNSNNYYTFNIYLDERIQINKLFSNFELN